MWKALVNALTNLFKPPHTHPYPQKDIDLPKAYRGLIEYNKEECTFCDKCEKVCPPGAIHFFQHPEGAKEYRYNPWVCIYCGECVRACPKPHQALWQSELKPPAGIKTDGVNEEWIEYEHACKESREAYAALRKNKPPKEE